MMPYRPLPSFLEVRSSPIEGQGVFTKVALFPRAFLGLSHVYDEKFPDNLIRTPLGGFINHSEDPNCQLVREFEFLSVMVIKEIDEGEELTLKYGRTKTLFEKKK